MLLPLLSSSPMSALFAAINASEGGFVHPSLTLRAISSAADDRGVFLTAPVDANVTLISVPYSLVIGPGPDPEGSEASAKDQNKSAPSAWLRTVASLMKAEAVSRAARPDAAATPESYSDALDASIEHDKAIQVAVRPHFTRLHSIRVED